MKPSIYIQFGALVLVAAFVQSVAGQESHPPYFPRQTYFGVIKENNTVGASILTISALDPENNPITYSLGAAANGLFTVDPTSGVISAASVYDREIVPGSLYKFTAKATDSISKEVASATVFIEIQDINDNAPVFKNAPYTATLSENTNLGIVVATAVASDLDQGLNALFTFSISRGNDDGKFSIAKVSGRITLLASLDYETKKSYFLTITAKDNAPPFLSSQAGVHVTVTDFDDQPPLFTSQFYTANPSPYENASINTIIGTVSAADQDVAIGNPVSYSIHSGNTGNTFKIDASSGVVSLQNNLDFETVNYYALIVQATEVGSSLGSALARMDIRVLNVNDNSPKFRQSAYTTNVTENAPTGTTLVRVEAQDNDSPPYNRFQYDFSKSSPINGRFTIDPSNGIITLAKTIDYEAGVKQLTFLVTVTDANPPGNSDVATLTINVIDVNDNNPIFGKDLYAASQDENTPKGTSIVRPLAIDQDTGASGTVTYSILSGDDDGNFMINTSTAVISNAKVLDREGGKDSFTLSVQASDSAQHKRLSHCVVNIAVNDLNDNSPVFSPASYTATLSENNALGINVAVLTATDADLGTNAQLTYTILSGNSRSAFEIRDPARGVVTARTSLDYELSTSYNLTVEVQDGGSSGGRATTATIAVTVLDQNDHSPVFSSSSYSFKVAENDPSSTKVDFVTATDEDGKLNGYGEIRYGLAGVYNDRFGIDAVSGKITTAQSIDREDPYGDVYQLLIIAEDQPATHKRRTTAQLTIKITDLNDNSPAFALKSYQATISENVVHSNFFTVSASDPDEGLNGQVTFSIIGGNNGSLFDIDAKTGDISTTRKPDREIQDQYSLVLQVRDGGNLTGTAIMAVVIRDVNDNNPVFDLLVYSRTISENDLIGEEAVRVKATEKDIGSNAAITYSITSGSPSSYVNSFRIGSVTGFITTKGGIDYEKVTSYSMTVTATDGDGKTGTCTVNVNVTDFNDNSPVFNPNIYKVSIDENSAEGVSVTAATATDADSGVNKALVFSIVSGDDGVFRINSTTGIVEVASNSPDYETKRFYTIDIQAQDQATPSSDRLVGIAKVEVTINDLNDNPPIFSSAKYGFQLVESATVGTTVGLVSASDADSSTNGNGVVTYSITNGNVGSAFQVSSSSGILTLTKILDRETIALYNLTVVASDSGKLTDTASLSVTILDINDNPPQFSKGIYTDSVDENVDLGTFVVGVMATEKDSDRVITYSLDGGDGRFQIAPASGRITTTNSIDYESVKSYTFQVTAQDNGTPPRRSSVPVTINVNDLNDNRPVFAQTTYRATVKENQNPGLSIATVSATDADSFSNAVLTYAIVSGNNGSHFRIDGNTGYISTDASLDREAKAFYSLQVRAADGGNPILTAVASVLVTVEDLNDNSPYFDPSSYLNVPPLGEDAKIGSMVTTVTAKDLDTGVNAKVLYSLRNGDGRFQVDRTNGKITTISEINREISTVYDLTIVATDSALSPLSASVQVKVTIEDRNDNSPVFSQNTYSGSVVENTGEGVLIAQVSASDADNGTFGEVVYEIAVGPPNQFKIDPTTGIVRTGSATLDRETATSHTLTIRASDKGVPAKTSTATVQVTVTDANDEIPVFSAAKYATSLSEQSLVGTTVLAIAASDDDVGTNAEVLYAFSDTTSINVSSFSLDDKSGVIKTTTTLNADVKKEYTFGVKVTDKGAPSLSSTATVTVTVQDVNDNDPTFNKTRYVTNVVENAAKDTPIVTVSASEADSGLNAKITYSITFGGSGKFVVNPSSGLISTTRPLDRESVSFYTLTVTAKDQGIPPRSGQTTVEITVLDQNDQNPVFAFSLYTASIPEGSASIGTLVATVSASDNDIGVNQQIQYSITGGNSAGIFAINDPNVGKVTTVKAMDREATPLIPAYVLNITATDQGAGHLTGTTQVQVTVTDINDNPPIFSNGGNYSATIPENLSGGSSVAHVATSDIDIGANAAVKFFVISVSPSVGSSQFTLDSDSGLLRTSTVSLDYESEKAYTFMVKAADEGSPQNTATGKISITVTDVNDNSPIFQNLPYKMTLAEGPSSLNVLVTTLTASDRDSGLYGKVRFSLLSGNEKGLFALNQTTGSLTVAQSLDYESSPSYTLNVRAEDQNGKGDDLTRKSATTTVVVTVTDINDNAPIFKPIVPVTIPENSLVGQPVITLTATDADSSVNADVTYAITKGNTDSDFTLDTTKGTILIAKTLDIERTARYDLEVTVTDKGTPPMSAVITVEINIADVNDNPPVFAKSSYSATYDEGSYSSANIQTVSASDKDQGVNGLVRYNITSGNAAKLFQIDAKSGEITVTGTLDRETTPSYDLTITATDQALVVRSGTTRVLVTLNDVNDNAPAFAEKSYTGTINENALTAKSVNMPILVKATDADIGINKVFTFSLSSEQFVIDNKTGIVQTSSNVSLDRESKDTYDLTLTVTDAGGLKSSVPFTVTVTDENDNSPAFNPKSYSGSIVENSTVGFSIVTVTASDLDLGVNAQIHYGIVSGAKFKIDPTSGVISVSDDLNRETNSHFVLNVSATDGGRIALTGYAEVVVTIVDVNDNAPVFSALSYVTDIPEDIGIGSFVLDVDASDLDSGVNGELRYDLFSGEMSNFVVNASSGEISTRANFDREAKADYTFTVRVTDNGRPQKSATTTVKIQVTDVNDNDPVFTQGKYSTDALESTANNSILLTVAASDLDLGSNGEIKFYVTNDSFGLFNIDNPRSGAVVLKGELDHEKRSRLSFVVEARDLGNPPRSALASVEVNVLDVNDNNPVFTETSYVGSVDENLPLGQSLVTVNATEKDASVIAYSITGGNEGGLFSIDSVTGLVSTNASLDRETADVYTFSVSAEDNDPNPRRGRTTVVIRVLDKNDQTPVFPFSSYQTNILEDVVTGSSLAIDGLSAMDGDINQNAALGYRLESQGNVGSVFRINSTTAVISTPGSLDRETMSNYVLTVTVYDSGSPSLSSNVTVSVVVTDVNDHSPQFVNTSYSASINEDVFGGFSVAAISSTDDDIGLNGDITYYILSGSEGKFRISPSSGIVTTSGSLDYESVKSYNLTLMAADSGVYPRRRNTTTWLSVTIQDVNDNSPIFTKSVYSATLKENRSMGSIVTVSASDIDSGAKGIVHFNITGGNPYGQFAINELTGVISLVRQLDFENTTSYRLNILAYDGGVPARTAKTEVTVAVTDVNDNLPIFFPVVYSSVVSEATNNNSVVAVVTATDRDHGTNADLKFQINGGNDAGHFNINPRSGEVYNVASLDREVTDGYVLTATVTDSPVNPHRVLTTISITVSDYNDNSPVFQPQDHYITIPEDFAPNGTLFAVNATDADIQENGRISYQITSGSEGLFTLNPVTGLISTIGRFDRERKEQYQIFVQGRDHGISQVNTGFGTLTVTISDVNDNSPYFEQTRYENTVAENSPAGTAVLSLSANDVDIGSNKQVTYTIIENGVPFAIDNSTGVVSTSAVLMRDCNLRTFAPLIEFPQNRETSLNYTFTVLASNSLSSIVLSGNTTVFVSVSDVNDNPPLFTKPDYKVSVSELLRLGTTIISVFSTDFDIGQAGKVVYSIIKGDPNTQFRFADPEKGDIVISSSLDAEKQASYQLTIQARDNGPTRLSSTAVLTVTVLDENDNSPVFGSKAYTFEHNEDLAVEWTVGIVSATDDDKDLVNDKILYEIIKGNEEGKFGIVDDSGAIVLVKALDYEQTDSYMLTVRASNAEAGVPRWPNIKYPRPIESRRRRRAVDGNSTDTPTAAFRTAPPSTTALPTGASTALPTALPTVSSSWHLNDTATVHVIVGDVNDNAPKFERDQYTAGVPVDAELDAHIRTVVAKDQDSGNYSTVRYRLLPGQSELTTLFRVDPATGGIYAANAAKYQEGQHYTLKISAFDNYGRDPYHAVESTVTIYVLTPSQQVRMILGVKKGFVVAKEDLLDELLENITGLIINLDKVQTHKTEAGFDTSQTDVFLHVIDPTTNLIVPRDEVIRILDKINIDLIYELLGEFNITSVIAAQPDDNSIDVVQLSLIIAASVIFFILLIVLILVCCAQRRRRKRKVRHTLIGEGVTFRSPPSTLQLDPYDMGIGDEGEGHQGEPTVGGSL
eukprot:m.202185 g.202185  ORF g.202185 m.202185 type:complete len:4095 (+) comp39606_c0_seq6:120-12404(+)